MKGVNKIMVNKHSYFMTATDKKKAKYLQSKHQNFELNRKTLQAVSPFTSWMMDNLPSKWRLCMYEGSLIQVLHGTQKSF